MRILPVVLALLVLCACSSSPRTSSQRPPLPPGFYLQLGEGGGFTGIWSGYEVDSSGYVTELSGRALGAVRKPAGQLSPEAMSKLWSQIDKSNIMAAGEESGSGNMTRSLSVSANGKKAHHTWALSLTGSSALDSLYKATQSLISTALAHP